MIFSRSRCCECGTGLDLLRWSTCPKIGYVCRTCAVQLNYHAYFFRPLETV